MTDKPAQSDAPSAEPMSAKEFYHTYGVKVPDLYRFAEAYAALRTDLHDEENRSAEFQELYLSQNERAEIAEQDLAACKEARESDIAHFTAKVAQLERERDEAGSEAAACLQFLGNSLHWEGFRGEMLTPKDDVKQQNCHAENVRLLSNYLKETGHGIKLLAALSEARESAIQECAAKQCTYCDPQLAKIHKFEEAKVGDNNLFWHKLPHGQMSVCQATEIWKLLAGASGAAGKGGADAV